MIYEIASSLKSVIPKTKQNISMIKKSKTGFYYMMVFAFNKTILLVCMWTRDAMSNTTIFQKGINSPILSAQSN